MNISDKIELEKLKSMREWDVERKSSDGQSYSYNKKEMGESFGFLNNQFFIALVILTSILYLVIAYLILVYK